MAIDWKRLVSSTPPETDRPVFDAIDTPHASYRIEESYIGSRKIRALKMNGNGMQSACYADGTNELVFWYTRKLAGIALEVKPRTILLLGGGGYSLPRYLSETLPRTKMTVVEIDPALIALARDHMFYRDSKRVTIQHQDARQFLRDDMTTYDLIIVDVYNETDVPYAFTTYEYGRDVAARLAPGGTLITNVIASMRGPAKPLMVAIDACYRPQLPCGQWATASGKNSREDNFILAYTRAPRSLHEMTSFNSLEGQPRRDKIS